MARKSRLLQEIGENIMKYQGEVLNVENIDVEILKSINKEFMKLEDNRHGSYDIHFMNEIIMIVFLGLMANCDEWTTIYMFAETHYEWLKTFLPLKWGLPSKSTIMRVMAMINPKDLEEICVNFMLSKIYELEKNLHLENIRDIIPIDGKSCNGSGRETSKDGKIKKVQAMSAYSTKYDMCLATEFIDDKTNEIPTAPKLLSRLNLENTIITFDALNTQEATLKYITKNHGDYVAAVKGNQGILYEDLIEYFEINDIIKEIMNKNYMIEREKSHGQIETRKYYFTSDVNWISNKKKWSKLLSVGMVEKTIEKDDKKSVERRYYISSLSENEFKEFTDTVRKEWEIENNLHWHLDVTFKEDKNLCSQKEAQKNLNILRKFCLNILKIAQPSYKLSIKNIRFKLSMNFEKEFPKLISLLDTESILNLVRPS